MRGVVLVVLCLGVLLPWTQAEPVKHCINEHKFNRASCRTIRKHLGGKWAEVRRLPLPFLMYNEEDCVEWEVSAFFMNQTHAKYHVHTQIDGVPVDGMDPVTMTLAEDPANPKLCHVEMMLSVPKLGITKHIKDWWITFDKRGQVMIGYTCIDNFKADERELGLKKRNMAFIYVEPQLTGKEKHLARKIYVVKNPVMLNMNANIRLVKESLDEMSQRLGYMVEEVEMEGRSYFAELRKSKCIGY